MSVGGRAKPHGTCLMRMSINWLLRFCGLSGKMQTALALWSVWSCLEGLVCKLGCLINREKLNRELKSPLCLIPLHIKGAIAWADLLLAYLLLWTLQEKTEIILVPLDDGGHCKWLTQCDGYTQRNHSQPGFWKRLVNQISWKSARLGPSKAIISELQGRLAWARSCSARNKGRKLPRVCVFSHQQMKIILLNYLMIQHKE